MMKQSASLGELPKSTGTVGNFRAVETHHGAVEVHHGAAEDHERAVRAHLIHCASTTHDGGNLKEQFAP